MTFKEMAKQGLISDQGIPDILERCAGFSECGVCRTRTNWYKLYMIHPHVPCCSEECMVELNERERADLEDYEASGPVPGAVTE